VPELAQALAELEPLPRLQEELPGADAAADAIDAVV